MPPNATVTRRELDRLAARNAKLRRRDQELNDQLKLAVAQIQFLALRAAQLEEASEAGTKVAHINHDRRRG
ncbi:hypothetical protein [Streptomyces sp. LUP47B]|uniref:hypothetical protein n=1 Tax=Streptomyces sp. LUP47B TaxID=1890286 RepID=UPI00159F1DF3|nr:hypothetical protein [Streptomyces sp. LUP47B]